MNFPRKIATSVFDTLKRVDFRSKIKSLRRFRDCVQAKRYAKAVTTFRRFAWTPCADTIS